MSVVDSSFLEWVEAIKSVNFDKALELALHSPSLLWHPIPFEESHYPHFSTHLQKLQHMKGISVPHFYAIQLLIVNLFENALPQSSTEAVLLSNLIEMAVAADLNTCFWGSTKNTTLHLASCLGQEQVVELLISQGALAHIPNSDGYVAIDFALTTTISDMLQQVSKHENPSINDSTVIKDNRFEQLRQLAEEGGNSSSSLQNTSNMIGKRQQSTRRYFQPGHLEARRKKVLQEDDNSATADESTRIGRNATNKRQQEVESLAKQSRVKNNPLFRKFEEQHQQQEYKQPTAHNRLLSPALETLADRRTSKGISSLKGRSFVSTSVFRQQEANVKDDLTINNSAVKPSKLRNEEIMDEFIQTEDTQGLPDEAGQQMTIENDQSSTTISNPPTTTQIKDPECTDTTVHNPISSDHPIQESVNETMSSLDKHNNNSDEDKKSINSFVDSAENMDDENRSISSSFASVNDSTKKSTLDTTRIPGIDQNRISHPTLETQSEQANKLSSLPASKESLLVKAGHLSVVSDTASDQWHDSYEVYPEDNSISGIVQRDSRKISSHGSLLIAQANTSTDVVQDNNWQAIDTTSVSTTKIEPKVVA
ncbi:uncharacterized protein BX664DRAFT_126421 [Halteromyces radiatus]|uniref:uncharacterized protein n=1 Tax=Halteromyces radiatus TaxID=101107 RepID=UPI00221F05BD|nr:uncharacterized protein BX664DRAFT_126421 [Halteromyces radiatus]KAI8089052.1 hypothetical protein BX664DRAFT_126421 [Halteromyces radiatus]